MITAKEIECETLFGKKKLILANELFFRPSVYGIVTNEDDILLLDTLYVGGYSLPGGGVGLGEKIEDALRREMLEETGIDIEIIEFLQFTEQMFYYDPSDVAAHCLLFFYLCRPKTLITCSDDQVDDAAVEKPRWVNISNLKAQDFHNVEHGQLILDGIAEWKEN
ncbi:MAG: NUDIX domain-containing protein [Anaerolineae bacterium]|jgi:nucleoside triphosphatase|nr:NUDIX domain-containing protein [Anaerolineae bacterium]MBT7070289.1 NUDIX domain-containing protein [Anaerolineae bacterium]MBT7990500.1 NUDIX domain-containing protein [Anaerolineae bacterium]